MNFQKTNLFFFFWGGGQGGCERRIEGGVRGGGQGGCERNEELKFL